MVAKTVEAVSSKIENATVSVDRTTVNLPQVHCERTFNRPFKTKAANRFVVCNPLQMPLERPWMYNYSKPVMLIAEPPVVPKPFAFNAVFLFNVPCHVSTINGSSEPCSWAADVGAPPEPSVSTNTYVEGKRSPEGLTNTDGFDLEVMQFRTCGGRFIDGVFALARPCDEDLVAFRIKTGEYRARIQPPVEDPVEDTRSGFFEDLGTSLKTSALIPHDLGACVHV